MASRANDSDDGGSMTPSEQSEAEDRSEHDSDYETDDGTGKGDEADKRDKALNIIWTGYGKKIPVMLFNASCILTKKSDFKTVGDRYHMTFKFGGAECKIIRSILGSHGFQEVHATCADFNLAWTSSHLKPFILRSLSEFQKINHFPRSSELTRKDRLYKNIQRMQQIKGAKHFDFVPQTFIMPNEYQEFCSQFLKDRGPWIVKPVASSRGRGVFLVNHPDQVPFDENVIVSHYLQNPLVIDGFKFDVRLYVAVTSYDPLVIYLYEEGLTRFATVKYEKNTKHMRNQCMHLTNYSVNKKSSDYVRNDDPDVEDYGNKWSMGAMLRYLRSVGKDTAALMMRIEDVVIKTLLSVELSIATACKMFMPYRGNCFELYGFDILVDDTLKPWVLEVNLSPSLACDSPLDLKIKGNMLCDLFSLTGIVCHDPMVRSMQLQCRRNQDLIRMTGRAKLLTEELQTGDQEGIKPGVVGLGRGGSGRGLLCRMGMRKTALTRTALARPKSRPQSASRAGAGNFVTQTGAQRLGVTGLNSEEIKIVRRVKEEEQRKGGWIRIFPGPDTWDVHGPFMQFHTTHNLMLHQRLYPERHKQMCIKSFGGSSISAAARSKTGYLQVMGTGQRMETDKSIESYSLATLRAKQYERKLGARQRYRKGTKGYRHKDSRGQLAQGIADSMEYGEHLSDEEYEQIDGRGRQQCGPEDKKPNRKESSTSTNTTTSSQSQQPQHHRHAKPPTEKEVKVEVTHTPPVPPPPPPHPPPAGGGGGSSKCKMVEALTQAGGSLSKVQARTAFAMYLRRVKERLVCEGSPVRQEDVDALNEQMDLVLRFLKRAAINLQQSFRVVVPSRKLPLGDRRHILAKQLADFVHVYNRETEQLKQQLKAAEKAGVPCQQASQRPGSETSVDDDAFNHYISKASEGDLEQMLTTYTRLNKSSSIFLGASISSSAPIPTKPPHNPLPAPQAQRLEMMQQNNNQRQETGLKEHSASCMDSPESGSVGGPLSQPSPEVHSSPSSLASSVSVSYSSFHRPKARPMSASSCCKPTGANWWKEDFQIPLAWAAEKCGMESYETHPLSLKLISRPSSAKPPFSTSETVVDTYNEDAIREALQRLTIKQQARQYSSSLHSTLTLHSPTTSTLTHTPSSSSTTTTTTHPPQEPPPPPPQQQLQSQRHCRGTLSTLDEQTDSTTTHPGTLVPSRPNSGKLPHPFRWQGQGDAKNTDRGIFTVTQSAGVSATPRSSELQHLSRMAQGDHETRTDYESLASAGSWPGGQTQSENESRSHWCAQLQPYYSSDPLKGVAGEEEKDVPRIGSARGGSVSSARGENGGKVEGSNSNPGSTRNAANGLNEHLSGRSVAHSQGRFPSQSRSYQASSLSSSQRPPVESSSLELRIDPHAHTAHKLRATERDTKQQRSTNSLMEANKAKHHAMVAQAHAAQRGNAGTNHPGRTLSSRGGEAPYLPPSYSSSKPARTVDSTEASIARGAPTFAPKPPAQPPSHYHPASSRTQPSVAGPHRVGRLSSVENLSLGLGLHSGMKYNAHSQLHRKAETNAGH